ncbi:xanthine dehydrogenase family protein subunit M [Actinobacteria bacterium YIM 96077]|uniref:Xanthine dehydrogenase family protein subunit M n=1 Tax=Phytoactinopolyspora halophila TaxID=1981511 RepID=A0A329QC17_9ACTN|nr:xanthine dehydrogenase family protein subunit M [Phytoactinopolyspora halophila]AYY14124.1 xanthine dehydrogenase family protein subunit M [Actinobacteria bacterium YIM 96077]RAW09940.1 xanthine dehydrogenase family protein subunit M [Phytoactinopolyspora halophila]
MIPAAFDYARPTSVDDAVGTLADGGEDAKILAGGQSLIPMLRLRLAAPTVVVDLGGVNDLRGVTDDGNHLVIGAMTTHDEIMNDPAVRSHAPLIAQATRTVADRQVRHMGTFGGSLAHADPAGDLPSVTMALDASFEIAGPSGRRSVPASEFFVDYLTTAMDPGEILVAVRVPKMSDSSGWGSHYEKLNRVAQAWALVGVAAMVQRDNGTMSDARVALTNMGPRPVRAHGVEEALRGAPATADAVGAAVAHAAENTEPADDVTASAEYRTHLASVLTGRAVRTAASI